MNLGKEDVVNPVLALWAGNALLGILAGLDPAAGHPALKTTLRGRVADQRRYPN